MHLILLPNVVLGYVPLSVFICDTAILRIVSLSGFLANVLHVGTMSHSSLMYDVILFLRRLSISQ